MRIDIERWGDERPWSGFIMAIRRNHNIDDRAASNEPETVAALDASNRVRTVVIRATRG
jgi:hypothetical protein